MVAKELIIDIDEKTRRVAWSAVGGRLTHHNAPMQFFADGDGTKAVWIADLLPNELAGAITGMIEQGLGAMKSALDVKRQEVVSGLSEAANGRDTLDALMWAMPVEVMDPAFQHGSAL